MINRKKFDIRQWVLVSSWEPLDVYVFSTAYLRLCTEEYSIHDLSDALKHLSNFSVQKKSEDDVESFVMSIPEFEVYLEKPGVWQNDLLPKVSDAIFKTLKGV